MIFFVESLHDFFVERLHDFLFVEKLWDFVCGEVAWFLCVERSHDFSHSLTCAGCMIYLSGGCMIFVFLDIA